MCEILIRVVDKINNIDPVLNSQLAKRGSVIVIADDDWLWTPMEKTKTAWRILKFPGVSVDDAKAAIALQVAGNSSDQSGTLTLNPDEMAPDLVLYLADNTRADWAYTLPGVIPVSEFVTQAAPKLN